MQKNKFKNIVKEIYQPIKEIIEDKNSKKYFVYLIIIYLVGYASILRADVYYRDDLGRALYGYSYWEDFSRHLSNIFSKLLHMGWKLSDISPLTQFIAIAILSTSSILLVKIINGRLRLVPIIASTCIGLFPYFLANISFKFDSPYMAFSVLSSILPFLWYRSKQPYFIAFSVLGVLGTMLTYQVASGVYLIILIALMSKDFLQKHKTPKENINILFLSLSSYVFALLAFKLLFMESDPGYEYVTTSIFPISELPIGIYHNLRQYFSVMINDLKGGFIAYASLFLCGLYLMKLFLLSKQNKLVTLLVSVVSLFVMASFLWGG